MAYTYVNEVVYCATGMMEMDIRTETKACLKEGWKRLIFIINMKMALYAIWISGTFRRKVFEKNDDGDYMHVTVLSSK